MNRLDLDTDRARRRLYSIFREDLPFQEKATRALELGASFLDVDHGYVTRIDPERDHWEVVASTDPTGGPYHVGLFRDLEGTYCRRTIRNSTSTAVHDAPDQGWGESEAEGADHCYHGTRLTIDGDVYGTVCFVAEEPRETPFRDGESLFAELLARLLEVEIAQERHQSELEQRATLLNVLNRVLRHNLRNDMNVIRGRILMLTEAGDDDALSPDPVIETVDELIALSERARELESIVRRNFDYQDVDAAALVRRVTGDVAREYPAGTFTVDAPEDVTLSAMASLETALRELVENAAKHAADPPTVTVSVSSSLSRVRLRVRDDGCGLPEQERLVLTEGVETPLVHGSGLGLWLVHWVVASHDGTVEATVADDGGTEVTVSLPRTPPV